MQHSGPAHVGHDVLQPAVRPPGGIGWERVVPDPRHPAFGRRCKERAVPCPAPHVEVVGPAPRKSLGGRA
eukprot:1774777-Lingulodinium_polyedra.AAC.1